jgi:oligoendopeptidase F
VARGSWKRSRIKSWYASNLIGWSHVCSGSNGGSNRNETPEELETIADLEKIRCNCARIKMRRRAWQELVVLSAQEPAELIRPNESNPNFRSIMTDLRPLDEILEHDLRPVITQLLEESLALVNVSGWLERWSELVKTVDELGAQIYRAATRDVSDENAQSRFEQFLEQVQPEFEAANAELKSKLLALKEFEPAIDQRQMLHRFRMGLKISDPKILEAQANLEVRASEYDEIVAGMTTTLNGEELGLPALQAQLTNPDRHLREAAWKANAALWAANAKALGELFQDLLKARNALAQAAGFSDYRALRWQELERFDQQPEDHLNLHAVIEQEFVPLSLALLERRRKQLNLEQLRPWDRLVDAQGKAALQPKIGTAGLEGTAARIFEQLDPQLATWFSSLRPNQLDLEARANKAPGDYCVFMPTTGLPFVHTNATSSHKDLMMLMHECGHAFHALASGQRQRLTWNLEGPVEFCELAAIGLEWLSLGTLENAGVYSKEDAARAWHDQLEGLIMDLPRLAAADAFQHWLYTTPSPSVTELNAKWTELWTRFVPGFDWTGLEEQHARGWLPIGHVFQSPFYMSEYILAGLGAAQIGKNARAQPLQTLSAYKAALELGHTRNWRELYTAAGVTPSFDQASVRALTSWLKNELEL